MLCCVIVVSAIAVFVYILFIYLFFAPRWVPLYFFLLKFIRYIAFV